MERLKNIKAINVNSALLGVVLAGLAWIGNMIMRNNDKVVEHGTILVTMQTDVKDLKENCVSKELLVSKMETLKAEVIHHGAKQTGKSSTESN